jgi:energy-coupling factor transporter ATP-binding protein EcfA2
MSTHIPNKLICQQLLNNIYDFTFLLSDGKSYAYQRKLDTEVLLTEFFNDPNCILVNKYGATIIDPKVPLNLLNGNIFISSEHKYLIVVEGTINEPNKCLINPNTIDINKEYICHGYDISETMNKYHLEDGYTCRYETVQKINTLLMKRKIVLLRAPPYCGKSTLLSFLKDYIVHFNKQNNTNGKVYSINCLNFDATRNNDPKYFDEFWKQQTGDNTYEETLRTNCHILIDEAQNLYNSRPNFWAYLKSIIESEGLPNMPKILVVSYYGDRPISETTTPIDFKYVLDYRDILLTENECDELIASYNSKKLSIYPSISSTIRDYIKTLTGRHVGLIVDTIRNLKTAFNTIKYDDGGILAFLVSGDFINAFALCRVVPRDVELSKYFESPYIDILTNIINSSDHYTKSNDLNSLWELIYKGIVTQTYPKNGDNMFSVIVFSSPLVMNIFNSKYTVAKTSTFNSKQWSVNEFGSFLSTVLSKMSLHTLERSFSKGYDGNVIERAWQNEFYRCAFSLLPISYHTISPDVGYVFGSTGKVDYYINGKLRWMIELTREGYKLKEHIDRFKVGGRYYVMSQYINSWIVLDFRHTLPTELEDNVWYIRYDFINKNFIIRVLSESQAGYTDSEVNVNGS